MKVQKTFKMWLLVSLLWITKTSLLAQSAGSYVFTKTNGNFSPVGSMTSVVNGDDIMSTSQTIGFTFNYAGTNYTSFKVSTNGFINLGGNLTGSLATNGLASTSNTPIIAPLWDDLVSTVFTELSGTPGNQVLTVEWRNVEWRYSATTAGFTFQAKLYEADGKIEFIYGDSTAASNTPTASIGINAAPGGAGNYLSVNALGTGASNGTETNNIAIWPGLNTVYVFQKPAVGPPTANFIASNTTPGAGDNVTLIDQSTANPSITAWEWTITPSTFTYVTGNQNSQSPVVAFQLGTYTVKLKVTNAQGSDSITKVNYITVSGYCTAGATSTGDTDIGLFTFDTFTNGSGATPVTNNSNATGTYSNFTGLGPIQATINGTYPISVSHITSGATFYNSYIKVFIDYNQNGVFEVPSEVVLEGGTTQTSATLSGNVTIPPTALTGLTRLRVVQREGGSTSTTTPCGTFTWGEVEDYTIQIQPSAPCTNPPVPGTASATPSTVFPGDPVYIDLAGYTGNVQWQYSTDGVNFMNITGANTVPDTLYGNGLGTFFIRAMVTTPNCLPDSSNIVTVTVNPRVGDLSSNPKLITTNFYTDTDSTFGYTDNYSGPNNQPSNDIFYQYIVPACIDSINVNTCLTAFDSYIHVLVNGTHVESDDDGCGGTGVGSKIVLDTTQFSMGDTILIVVEGWNTTQGTYTFSLNAYSSIPNAPAVLNDTICAGNNTTLSVSNPDSTLTYNWYADSIGGTPIATGISFTTDSLFTDTVYYVEAANGSCISSRTMVQVAVTNLSSPIASNDTICIGDSTVLIANGTGTIYWFDADSNLIATGNSFVTSAIFNDTAFYVVSELNGCFSAPTIVNVIVNTPGIVIPNVPDTVQVGQPFQVSASGGLTYLWNFGPVAVPDTAVGPGPHTVTMMLTGTYFITLKYTVECGSGLDSIIIPIFVEQSTKIVDNAFQSVVVYPNPNKGSFNLQVILAQNSPLTFEVFNSLGQKVYQKEYREVSVLKENYSFHLPSGVYSYRLVSANGVYSGKLIIE